MAFTRSVRRGLARLLWLPLIGLCAPALAAPSEPAANPAFPAAVEELPETLDYDSTRPIPEGYVLRQRPRRGLLVSGSIVFGVGYGLSVLGAASPGDKDIDGGWLLVPVVGPLIALTTQHKTCVIEPQAAHCERSQSTVIVLGMLTTMQVVGASLFTWGVAVPRRRLERKAATTLSIGPTTLGRSGYGMAAFGQF
jgi:hypothetical protein